MTIPLSMPNRFVCASLCGSVVALAAVSLSSSAAAQAAIPANAQSIRADGTFILPGLWDSQVSYNWYYGEVMLNDGITSNKAHLIVRFRD